MGGAEPRLGGPARLVFGLSLAAYIAAAGWLVWRTSILEAYSDMYDWVGRWRQFQADGDLGRYLWAPHNFHHLVWTFGVLDLDIAAFGARSYLFIAVGTVCLAALAGLSAWVGAAAAGPGLRLLGGGVAAALCLTGCNVLDATADINTTYLHAVVFAVAAILLAAAPGTRSRLRMAGSLACAIAAGLGSAAGLAVWPALLFVAWRRGDRAGGLATAIGGAGFSLLYLLGQASSPSGSGGGLGVVGNWGGAVLLTLNYLGLPWMRAAPGLGAAIGAAVLAISLVALATKGRRGAAWTERAAVGLIVFSLATAVMAGLARTSLIAPSLVPMRYSVFLSPLHAGLWVLGLPYLRRAFEPRPRAFAVGVMAAAGFMLAHQAVMMAFAVRTADENLRFIADYREGRRYPQMQPIVYSDLGRIAEISAWMRLRGVYQAELRPDPPPQRLNGSGISASSTGP